MSKTTILFLITLFLHIEALSQSGTLTQVEQDAGLKISTQFLHPFFFGSHEINYKNELSALNADYEAKVVFNIDTAGLLTNLSFQNKDLPEQVKSYVTKLLFLAEGLWQPEIIKGKKATSSEITGIFVFTSRKLSFNKRAERKEAMLREWFDGKDILKVEENIFDNNRKNFFAVFLGY